MNIPTLLTLSRVFAVPPIIYGWRSGHHGLTLAVLVMVGFTDYLDGNLSRRWNQTTSLGALLDPVCDKFYVLAFFSFLYFEKAMPVWFYSLICIRNISQLMAIPILSWWLKIPFKVRPKPWPKIATALSFFLIWVYFLKLLYPLDSISAFVMDAVVGTSAVLETYILVTYVPRLIQIATGKHDTFE